MRVAPPAGRLETIREEITRRLSLPHEETQKETYFLKRQQRELGKEMTRDFEECSKNLPIKAILIYCSDLITNINNK